MDETRPSNRSKRQKPPEDGFWECSVCTFRNSPEAYKCDMCDIRKGTSTRKPRLNSQLVAQQAAQQFTPVAPPAKRERNSAGPELNSDFEFSDNSNQGNISHLFEEPLSNLSNNNILDHDLDSTEHAEVVPEYIKPEKHEKEKLEKQHNVKHEKPVKPEKKPKKINKAPKVKKSEKLERSEEKMSVTVNNVTVIITDYVPKTVKKERQTSTETNNQVDNSDNSSVSGGSNCAGEDLLMENHHHHHHH